jgi:hypothetical protein
LSTVSVTTALSLVLTPHRPALERARVGS